MPSSRRFISAAAIATGSPVTAEAGAFIRYFVFDAEANRILGAERGVPVVAPVRQSIIGYLDEQAQAVFYYIDGVSRWSSPMSPRFPARKADYRELFGIMTREVSFGRVAPDEAPVLLRDQIAELLAEDEER